MGLSVGGLVETFGSRMDVGGKAPVHRATVGIFAVGSGSALAAPLSVVVSESGLLTSIVGVAMAAALLLVTWVLTSLDLSRAVRVLVALVLGSVSITAASATTYALSGLDVSWAGGLVRDAARLSLGLGTSANLVWAICGSRRRRVRAAMCLPAVIALGYLILQGDQDPAGSQAAMRTAVVSDMAGTASLIAVMGLVLGQIETGRALARLGARLTPSDERQLVRARTALLASYAATAGALMWWLLRAAGDPGGVSRGFVIRVATAGVALAVAWVISASLKRPTPPLGEVALSPGEPGRVSALMSGADVIGGCLALAAVQAMAFRSGYVLVLDLPKWLPGFLAAFPMFWLGSRASRATGATRRFGLTLSVGGVVAGVCAWASLDDQPFSPDLTRLGWWMQKQEFFLFNHTGVVLTLALATLLMLFFKSRDLTYIRLGMLLGLLLAIRVPAFMETGFNFYQFMDDQGRATLVIVAAMIAVGVLLRPAGGRRTANQLTVSAALGLTAFLLMAMSGVLAFENLVIICLALLLAIGWTYLTAGRLFTREKGHLDALLPLCTFAVSATVICYNSLLFGDDGAFLIISRGAGGELPQTPFALLAPLFLPLCALIEACSSAKRERDST